MGKIVERKRKKKGRPSLLDLQKGSLEEQKQQLQLHKCNKSNPNSATPVRRSTCRNPSPDDDDDEEEQEEEEADDDEGGGREKQLNLFLRHSKGEKSEPNSPRDASDSNADGDARKRKIDAIGDGSAPKTPPFAGEGGGVGKVGVSERKRTASSRKAHLSLHRATTGRSSN